MMCFRPAKVESLSALAMGCALILGLAGLSFASAEPGLAARAAGQSYYLQTNMRYDDRNAMATLNLQAGAILPVGTAVTIRSADENRIVFTVEGHDEFVFVRDKYGRRQTIDEFFSYYFGAEDPLAPGAPIHDMSLVEQRNIADGTLALGMSKQAALMAAGYPPSHRTASPDEATWTYWRSRSRSFRVSFDADGSISELRGY